MASGNQRDSRSHLLPLLNTRGPQTTAWLAGRLSLTAMGVRQHLAALREEGKVQFEEQRRGVGRPARLWSLTEAAQEEFPDGHADLAVDLLTSLREAFGAAGLERLVAARSTRQLALYRAQLPGLDQPLAQRVAALARRRREEGYMAEWSRRADGSFFLVENHCPICAAATLCQGLCGGELEVFQSLLGPEVEVERVEHILEGARRCAYRIAPRVV